ncbi:MAG: translation initiation factor IF-3 [Oscillospiraceae bacterium]|nr:translation initiation factor IF-3 [Candidatus Equicaccousia limihippi]
MSVLFFIWRCFNISKQELPVGDEITEEEVRVINADGTQLGIIKTAQALKIADEQELDLVMISPNATPKVCKIMNYGKYKFEQTKREKEMRKNQKTIETKEIRLGLSTDVHDFDTKVRHAVKFLQDGNKVKVSIRFRGRELGHPEIGKDNMERFAEKCADVANVEKPAKMEGRNMLMFLAPKTK